MIACPLKPIYKFFGKNCPCSRCKAERLKSHHAGNGNREHAQKPVHNNNNRQNHGNSK